MGGWSQDVSSSHRPGEAIAAKLSGGGFLLGGVGLAGGGSDGLPGGVGEKPHPAKGRRDGALFLSGWLGAFWQFAFGETLGGEAEVLLQRDGGIALAADGDLAATVVALLLLVALD